jgi:ABC-2 type transport system permease protein
VAIVGLILLPRLVGSEGTAWTLAVVNEGPADAGRGFTDMLGATPRAGAENTYRLLPADGSFDQLREDLNRRVESREIDGYVVLPADLVDGGAILFRARNVASLTVMRDLRSAGNQAVQSERLRLAGIEASALAALTAPVQVEQGRITAGGEERGEAVAAFLAAYALAFLMYFMTTLYGVAVMHSVLEEKTSRTAEMLMSTVRASHVMAGKIIGVGSAALTQVSIWVAVAAVAIGQSARLSPEGGFSNAALQALGLEPLTGVLLLLFFILGFFLYASMFAIVGASVTSQQESQSVQFIALLPLMTPLLFLQTILNAPLGRTATTLGLVPFTAPIAMPMRMASTAVPGIEIAASLASMVCGIAIVAWVAGKVYRVGILSTGKRPSLTELARWVRSA